MGATTSPLCFVELDGDEIADASLRAVTFARRLAPDVSLRALLAKEPGTRAAEQLAAFGVAEARYLAVADVTGFAPLALARALEELSEATGDGDRALVVAAATDHGNEVLAHLGARTGLEFVANCVDLRRLDDGDGFGVVRHRWGGSLLEDARLRAPGALFSVAPDAVAAAACPDPGRISVAPISPTLGEEELLVHAVETRAQQGGVSLASAKVVVSGGRGIGSAEGFAVLEELAGLLGGAVGVSRAVTSAGWRPHREQVGQTGTKVTPTLYLACGISGAIQHLAGCQGATNMIAINTDPDAPIMARADYAVIGDAQTILPALAQALRERRSNP